ncbi:MAG: DUF4405 domain-containing protein [Prevotellaceae bacterium]|nr:DUF4405 domain-containing protein [Prevotellaceae bacterium]
MRKNNQQSPSTMSTKFNTRAFISTSLFLLIATLFVTGVTMEVVEAVADPETATESMIFMAHFVTAIHVICGFMFVLLAVLHVIKNWKTLLNHIKIKTVKINREALLAMILFLALVGLSWWFTCLHF